jgi:acetylornithine/succinyldiaminopimelate/putrescine aminotransferase
VPFGELDALERAITGLGPENVAAVVLEPIQGEAGVIVPPPGYLRSVGSLCRCHGILVVADEIQTGLGRTGHWFESLAQGLEPDIIALGKALSGGMAPIGVTIARRDLCRRAVGDLGGDRLAGTYSGNSLSTAIAVKSLDMLIEHDLPDRAQAMGQRGLERLQKIQARHPRLLEAVRGAGMLFALQLRPVIAPDWLHAQADAIGNLTSALGFSMVHQAGVQGNIAMNTRRVVRLSPALTMPDALFDEMWNRVERATDLNDAAWRLMTRMDLPMLLGFANLARATAT